MQSSSEIEIFTLTPSDDPAWQVYVNSHPDATIYHTLEWRDILYNEYGFEPVYLIARETNPPLSPFCKGGDNRVSQFHKEEYKKFPPLAKGGEGGFSGKSKVVGILPMLLIKNLRGRRLVSLPFSIYGGPLGDTGELVSALVERSVEMVRNGAASSFEIRPHKPVGDDIGLVSSESGLGTTVDLSVGIDGLWKRLTDRNDINRAVREGLNFRISDGEGIERFYRLQLMTRKRLGFPTPSLAYYRSFFERMQGIAKLALVEKEGVPVAGGIFFAYKGSILYALGASEQKYLYCRPNDMMIWEMMKWGCENGFKAFDLGPTPIFDKGLLHFKEKWGGEHRRISRFYFPSLPQADKGSRVVNQLATVVFKLLPESVASHVGYYAAKRMG